MGEVSLIKINKYFKHFFKQEASEGHNSIRNSDEVSLVKNETEELEQGVEYTKVGLKNLLNPISDDDVVGDVTIESFSDFFANRNEKGGRTVH